MFKWHVNSAIGRGRPFVYELGRKADTIPASWRVFHDSPCNNADQTGAKPPPAPKNTTQRRPTQKERSATAAAEISGLKPNVPRGIDARSLDATPPPQLRIIRVDGSEPTGPKMAVRKTQNRSRPQKARQAGEREPKEGRESRDGRKKKKSEEEENEAADEDGDGMPVSEKQMLYVESIESGIDRAYPAGKGMTKSQLRKWGPAVPTKFGLSARIEDRLRIQSAKLGLDGPFKPYTRELRRREIKDAQEIAGLGRYEKMEKMPEPGDAPNSLLAYPWKNSTYTAKDGEKLRAKFQALIAAAQGVSATKAPTKEE